MIQTAQIHDEQMQMRIFGQRRKQRTARLFQGNGHRPAAEPLGQLRGPGINCFRCVFQFAARSFPVAGLHAPIVFLVGPIQPDVRGEGVGVVFEVVHFSIPFPITSVSTRRQDLVSAKAL